MLFKGTDAYYHGQSSYRYVERLLRRGRELYIVSPYIDAHYARFIKSISGNKRIYIISSSMSSDASALLSGGRSPWPAITLSLILVLIDYLAWLIHPDLYLPAASMLVILFSALLFLRKKPGIIRIKKPAAFVHAKMYISEGEAIEGSANLTYSGMHRNIEGISIVHDGKRIDEMKEHFWRMWKDY